jgi:protein-L-isoaspartate(D-aspartate) O-methyltransferase
MGIPASHRTTRYAAPVVTSTADTDEAVSLRNAMADRWEDSFPAPVEQTMRTVPRHAFLPSFPLEEAYAETVPVTHRDSDGSVLSCATLPSCMARMLAQLDVHPGHRVLEIGAGTGYNAALLAHLTGPSGHVTTIDIHADVAADAQRHLTAAGYDAVQVICGDGALGHAAGAPYDRIIVTAGAWDIPSAWTQQAAPGCRMVLPLRIAGFTNEVTLELQADGPLWRSSHRHLSGFIHMRGSGHHLERDVPITPGGEAELRLEGDLSADPGTLQRVTRQPPIEVWTGVTVDSPRLDDLEAWLASLGGLGRLINRRPDHGLAPAIGEGGSLAVLDTATGDTFAYLTVRPAPGTSDDSDAYELGVISYGPRAERLAVQVRDRVRTWHAEHTELTTWIEIHPAGSPAPPDSLLTADKQHVRVVVRSSHRA